MQAEHIIRLGVSAGQFNVYFEVCLGFGWLLIGLVVAVVFDVIFF